MKQSSIEWLFEQYKLVGMLTTAQVEKAKAMHKEEHRKTFNQGLMSNFQNFEDYYNETFNTREK